MGVDQVCTEYSNNQTRWKNVRDAVEGEASIKAGGTVYLPKPSGQDNEDYRAYCIRPHWFGATGRTAEGLHGMIFAKKPIRKDIPPALEELLKNIDRSGKDLDQFTSDLSWDVQQTNWGGILVDFPTAPEGINKLDSGKLGLRPYAAWYNAESVINWRKESVNNQQELTLVVLKEPYQRKIVGNEFATETKNRYRVLSFDEAGDYMQRIYDDGEVGGIANPIGEPTYPKIDGKNLKRIPFFTVPGKAPEKSMLLDLAYENIGHFQKMADYENGLHWTGVPTPYATGHNAARDDKTGEVIPIKLGGSTFLIFPEPDAVVSYLEFEGKGLDQGEKAIQNCEERMAILGARIISAEKKGIESAEAAKIHRAGENAVLGAFAQNMANTITQVIRLIGEWAGIPGSEKATYELNTDYDVAGMDSQSFAALTNARLQGKIPETVYFWNLQHGEYTPPGMDLDQFVDELAKEGVKHGTDGDDLTDPAGTESKNKGTQTA